MTATTTTAATATTTGLILALDLGKYKSIACAYDRAAPGAPRFESLTTDRDHLRRLFERHRPAVVVFEACLLAGWVHDLCAELGLACKVANTASEAWKFKHTKRKTDKDDALRLAELEALGRLPAVVLPDPPTRQWRQLIAYRQTLVGRRVAAQNRLRAILVGQGLPAPRGARAWTATGLRGIASHAKPLAECGPDELWRGLLDLTLTDYRQVRQLLDQAEARLDELGKANGDVQLLETTPGLGPRTAEAVVAHLHKPERFTTGKQVSAYGGLVPRQYQSGDTDRRGRITRRGPALLRKLLVECAWAMLRYNAWARAVYLRLTHGGKTHKKQAIVALARKLLVRCWAMLRDRQPWRAQPAVAPP
jgi:transposase